MGKLFHYLIYQLVKDSFSFDDSTQTLKNLTGTSFEWNKKRKNVNLIYLKDDWFLI